MQLCPDSQPGWSSLSIPRKQGWIWLWSLDPPLEFSPVHWVTSLQWPSNGDGATRIPGTKAASLGKNEEPWSTLQRLDQKEAPHRDLSQMLNGFRLSWMDQSVALATTVTTGFAFIGCLLCWWGSREGLGRYCALVLDKSRAAMPAEGRNWIRLFLSRESQSSLTCLCWEALPCKAHSLTQCFCSYGYHYLVLGFSVVWNECGTT